MPGTRNKGFILISVFLFVLGVFCAIFVFVNVISLHQAQFRTSSTQVKLDLLGTSGLARARWLKDNSLNHYYGDIPTANMLEDKIQQIKQPASYVEVFPEGRIYLLFSQTKPVFYLYAELNSQSNNIPVRVFYTCAYIPGSSKITNIMTN